MNIIKAFNEGQNKYDMRKFDVKTFSLQLVEMKTGRFTDMPIYEWINNPKYAVVETLSSIEAVRDDFREWMKMKGTYYTTSDTILLCGIPVYRFEKQMLKGYWQDYILKQLNKGGVK